MTSGASEPQILFRYHHEDGKWWAESDECPWVGQCDTLEELRIRAAEGIRFVASDGEVTEPRATSLLFVHWHENPLLHISAPASESFVLGSVDG